VHRVVVLLLLAACDDVYGLDGRHEPDGGETPGDDGSLPGDGTLDPTCTFVEPSTSGIAAGEWYPDQALATAVRMNSGGSVEYGHATGKTVDMLTNANYSNAFIELPANYSAMFHPSLSADGGLLVGSIANTDGVTYRLAIAARVGQMFSTPVVADLRTKANATWTLDVGDTPSGPTSTDPRLMLVQRSQQFTEVVQTASGWRASSQMLATSLGLGVISYASLTSDGLGVVVVGTTTANPGAQKVLRATRATIDDSFSGPIEIFRPLGVGVSAAYLTVDCSKLYFVQAGEVRYVEH
jgi:hypothetical protein